MLPGRRRAVLPVDILRRGGAQSGRVRPAATPRRLPPQSVEHHGLRRGRQRVDIVVPLLLARDVIIYISRLC